MTKEHWKVEKHKKNIDMQNGYLIIEYNMIDFGSDGETIIAVNINEATEAAEIFCSGYVAGCMQRSKEFQD